MLLNFNLNPENYTASVGYQRRYREQNQEIRVRITGLGYVSHPLSYTIIEKRVDKLLTNMLSKDEHRYPKSF